MVFPHKDCILEGGQEKEDTKRDEIFYNTILAPDEIDRLREQKVLTNWKKFNKQGKHKVENVSKNDNLVIKGNNLLALYSLLPNYTNKIKLIYIDPPYNTGNDGFKYNDDFNHSSWLTFIKNRLEIARELLSDDGVIFVQCDHHELGYLNILMDEIFEQKNKIQVVSIKTSAPAGFKTVNPGPIDVTEYILYYSKNKSKVNFKKSYTAVNYNSNYNLFIDNIEDIPKKWKLVPLVEKFYELQNIKNNKEAKEKWGDNWKSIRDVLIGDFALCNADKVVSKRDPHNPTDSFKKLMKDSQKVNYVIEFKRESNNSLYLYGGGSLAFYKNKLKKINGEIVPTELLTDFWSDISWAGIANEGGVKLKNGKKPERLLRRIIEMNSEKDDIVLDFFAGSGSIGHAVMDLNEKDGGKRQFIINTDNENKIMSDFCYPRIKNVIKGYNNTIGVGNSIKFYRTAFVGKNNILNADDKDKIELAHSAGEMLAVAENTLEEVEKNDYFQLFENNKLYTAVYFREEFDKLKRFEKKIRDLKKPVVVYIFSWEKELDFNDFENNKNIITKTIPQPILEIYKQIYNLV